MYQPRKKLSNKLSPKFHSARRLLLGEGSESDMKSRNPKYASLTMSSMALGGSDLRIYLDKSQIARNAPLTCDASGPVRSQVDGSKRQERKSEQDLASAD